MAFSIKNPEADRLARELSQATGESLTDAVTNALSERLERVRRKPGIADRVLALSAESRAYPVLDPRSGDDILGYDDTGVPR